MQTPKIVIEVCGGVVENVFSNVPIEYVLVDHDNLDCEEGEFNLSPLAADKVKENLASIFQERYKKGGYREKRNKRLVEVLTDCNF